MKKFVKFDENKILQFTLFFRQKIYNIDNMKKKEFP